MSIAETKVCQNCKQSFVIEPEDFAFYERIKVPPPTWCPECRLQRRFIWRNERRLYKRKCDATGKDIISVFSADKPLMVYDQKYWWSDNWDALSYGRVYSFSKSFFEQFKNLMSVVPMLALLNKNAINSDYCHSGVGNKDSYLVSGGDFNERVAYSTFSFHCKDSLDLYWVNKSELCYETLDSENCFKLLFSRHCQNCSESAFLYNCINCSHCFGCVNLRNKSYCIFNIQYSKEEYQKKLGDILRFGNFEDWENAKLRFHDIMSKSINKFAIIVNSRNVFGNNIYNSKNCLACFDVYDVAEDCKNMFIAAAGVKDSFDVDHIGLKSELCYEGASIFPGYKTLFSSVVWGGVEVQYSYNCQDCQNLFGCIGLRNKEYCILNKQYTKQEYEELVPRIIEHMNKMPYVDKKGRVYKYGEFFPPELSPFAYNETIAQEYFPLTKEQALAQGYRWKDPEERNIKPDYYTKDLADHIKDVKDDILGKIIQCAHSQIKEDGALEANCNEQCTTAFKIIPQELEFYRRINLPLPRLCPNCRHFQRLKQRNPLKLWHRKCQRQGTYGQNPNNSNIYQNQTTHFHQNKSCPNEFYTSYAPDRPEIVYCDKCYQAEVY